MIIVEGAYVLPNDPARSEYATGHVVTDGTRIFAGGSGPAPAAPADLPGRRVDGSGCLVTPGFGNTHHHLYRWVTRGFTVDLATMGGARVRGRQDEIGSLEVGKLADVAVWRPDTLAHIDVADPVALAREVDAASKTLLARANADL